jgi:hypothetical protein
MSGIALEGCVPEVYDFKELVSWCIDKFDKNQENNSVARGSPISLAPSFFKRMLRLPEPTMNFKGDEAKEFFEGQRMEDWSFYENILKTQQLFQRTFQAFRSVH